MDIPRGCSEAVRTPLEVNGHYRKPQGPIGMVREEGHGYEICLRICTDIYGSNHGQQGQGLQMIRTPQGQ